MQKEGEKTGSILLVQRKGQILILTRKSRIIHYGTQTAKQLKSEGEKGYQATANLAGGYPQRFYNDQSWPKIMKQSVVSTI